MTIRFTEDDVRAMGRGALGCAGHEAAHRRRGRRRATSARDDTSILMVTESGYGKRTQLDRFNRQGRGGQGVIGIKLTARKGQVVAAFMVGLDDEIVAHLVGRHHHPQPGPRDLLAGPRRHRRAGHEPRAGPGRGVGRADPRQHRQPTEPPGVATPLPLPPTAEEQAEVDMARARSRRSGSGGAVADRRCWRSGLVLLLALGRVAVAAVNAARARTAADAAALAGAQWGEAAASASAADNGGRLVRFTQLGADVLVTVEVGAASATARATLYVERIRSDDAVTPAGGRRTLSGVAIEDGTAGSAEPRTEESFVTGGHTNGRASSTDGAEPRSAWSAKGPFGGLQPATPTAAARAAAGMSWLPAGVPAVPLVPPVRSTTLPNGAAEPPTGTTSPSPVSDRPDTVDRAGHRRPARTRSRAASSPPSRPSPPAPGRARPPVRLRMARRPRVRKVNRVVRRIDAWSVFKISLVFWAVVVRHLAGGRHAALEPGLDHRHDHQRRGLRQGPLRPQDLQVRRRPDPAVLLDHRRRRW